MSSRSRTRVQSIIDPAAPRGRHPGERRPWYAPLLAGLRVIGAIQARLIPALVVLLALGLLLLFAQSTPLAPFIYTLF